jgi:hypothetical protein
VTFFTAWLIASFIRILQGQFFFSAVELELTLMACASILMVDDWELCQQHIKQFQVQIAINHFEMSLFRCLVCSLSTLLGSPSISQRNKNKSRWYIPKDQLRKVYTRFLQLLMPAQPSLQSSFPLQQ